MEVITLECEAYKKLTDKINRIADFVLNIERPGTKDPDNDIWMNSNEIK